MIKTIAFKNKIFNKKELRQIIQDSFVNYGAIQTCLLADELKTLGFNYATKAGISISIEDLKVPAQKNIFLEQANFEISKSEFECTRGEINFVERFQKILDTWNKTNEILKENVIEYFSQTDPFNPIYLMAFSGARGNLTQVKQLVGMRGLMSDPNGKIIDIPIIHNFREGLSITDYIMSAYGARKGVVDTALRTADSGYLTRRLVDVAQDVIIREYDCSTEKSIRLDLKENNQLIEKILGRTIAETIFTENKEIIVKKKEIITLKIIENLLKYKIEYLKIYSPLSCEAIRSICQKCYGWDLSRFKPIELGKAIGIIAAQSIGEPGTQMTMRTFHTGGIFTSDFSREIRVKNTGIFYLDEKIKLIEYRTSYGLNAQVLEKEGNCDIIDFNNKKISFKLPATSIIFVKNGNFIKKGQLIAELPQKSIQTLTAKKTLKASNSGELVYFEKKKVLWIFNAVIYDITNNIIYNKNYKQNKNKSLKDNFFYSKIITTQNGFLKINQENIQKNSKTIEILNKIETFFSTIFFWEKYEKKCVLLISPQIVYILNELSELINTKNYLFAEKKSAKYISYTENQLILINDNFYENDKKYKKNIIKKNGKILLIPIETYSIDRDKSVLLVSNNTKLSQVKTELTPGIFSKTDGFLQIKEIHSILKKIYIKPCTFYEFINLKKDEIEYLKQCNKKIFFPGEILLEDILIKSISLIEFIKLRRSFVLLIREIKAYNIAKPKTKQKNNNLNSTFNSNFERKHFLNVNTQKNEDYKEKTYLIKEFISIEQNLLKKNQNFLIKYSLNAIEKNYTILKKLNKNSLLNDLRIKETFSETNNEIFDLKKKKQFLLTIISNEILEINKKTVKKSNNEIFKLALFIKNFEYVEKNTIVGKVSFISKKFNQINNLEKKNKKLILSLNDNFHNYYNDLKNFYFKKNSTLLFGEKIGPLTKIQNSGRIIFSNSFKISVQTGTPFFITSGIKLKKNYGFIKNEETIGWIKFEEKITEDIIQGLPKIEEILEARKMEDSAILSNYIGIIKKIKSTNHQTEILILGKNNFEKNSIQLEKKVIVKLNEYIFLGKPLTKGGINPHHLLKIYFDYYKKYNNSYESASLSLKNLQIILAKKLQQIYKSQGIYIADKHVELILKKMTSKIKITNIGPSFFLPGEILGLEQIRYINEILNHFLKKKIKYKPILVGITKASLIADGFISAASFQETTRILTTAAIEGKIDWLRGLKENITISKLLPIANNNNFKNDN